MAKMESTAARFVENGALMTGARLQFRFTYLE
jgi:hypothetical protein